MASIHRMGHPTPRPADLFGPSDFELDQQPWVMPTLHALASPDPAPPGQGRNSSAISSPRRCPACGSSWVWSEASGQRHGWRYCCCTPSHRPDRGDQLLRHSDRSLKQHGIPRFTASAAPHSNPQPPFRHNPRRTHTTCHPATSCSCSTRPPTSPPFTQGELTAPMGTNRTGVKSTGRHWMPPKISGAEAKRRISSLGMSQREIGILLGIGERQMRRYLSRDPTPVIIRLALTLLARMTTEGHQTEPGASLQTQTTTGGS